MPSVLFAQGWPLLSFNLVSPEEANLLEFKCLGLPFRHHVFPADQENIVSSE